MKDERWHQPTRESEEPLLFSRRYPAPVTQSSLSSRERLERALRFDEVDRIPTIGGWIGGVKVLSDLAEISTADYLKDPLGGVVRAHLNLGVDGMISPVVPTRLDQIRTGLVEESRFEGVEPEDLVIAANQAPSDDLIRRQFDWQAEEALLRGCFDQAAALWRGILPLPNFWDMGGHFPLYTRFGYEAFLSACALFPDAVQRLWEVKSLHSRLRAEIMVRLYRELNLVPVMFCGEDLCNSQGPMVSPVFLRERYFPTVSTIIEPLVDSGIKLIHHCDGDVRPLVQDFLDLGFRGLQGFQYECGVSIKDLRNLRTLWGEPPLIWAGLSVSTTLPFGSTQDVESEVEGFIEATEGRGLFLFTSNVTGVEVPPENILAGCRRAQRQLS